MARVVFLGTPAAAVPTLETLHRDHQVALVVTQPDRPKGRSKKPVPPPVKQFAIEHGLTVAQPASHTELASTIADHAPFAVGVVVAYGRILRQGILETPEHGLVNVHFSLLPRWRGAAPVARALMAGDPMTGVTLIKLDEGLDTGPVITAQAVDIGPQEDAGALTGRLAALGARFLADTIGPYVSGDIAPTPQSDEGATYAEKITSADRPLDVNDTRARFIAKVRGLAPDPAATLMIDGERHKILEAHPAEPSPEPETWVTGSGDTRHEGYPIVTVGGEGVVIISLQPPGRKPMSGDAWVRGRHSDNGTVG